MYILNERKELFMRQLGIKMKYVLPWSDDEDDMKSKKILIELENIDDDCDDIGIDFVKISDEGIAQEYDIASMPALVYFRHRFPQIYEGEQQRHTMFELSFLATLQLMIV